MYVTPEEWRKQIGEEEWSSLAIVNKSLPSADRVAIYFQGKKYTAVSQINSRLQTYWADDAVDDGIGKSDDIVYDTLSRQVLFRKVTFNVGVPAIANSFMGLKFWMNEIDDCPSSKLPESLRFMAYNEYTNLKENRK